ncbi:FtsX-like permease family protein [Sphingomonas sanxanigenens]|uniref:ABC3 transporter permease C-terminal domain-containing protein n=1 Tax=Sphingomonas sanxanigenens DSM 19645 = NX02 TaxID=1123269 RepID=W0AGG0_9SPHN|nr:FtsX-like permease family protein [Sphingomonas sanxanigenens]AHE55373.1 hypothetical protein NX02_18520 [Sphingomonas sanxanigenens DSM 19645 = NX02]
METEPGIWRARLALRWLILGEWRFHPARYLLTATVIAVGVALGFAVHLVNGSALASFSAAIRGVNGAAELSVRATSPLGFDERLYPVIARADGVRDVSPVARLDARLGRAPVSLLGLDVIRASAVTPALVGAGPQGPGSADDTVFDEDAIFLSRAAMAASGAKVGARVPLTANGTTRLVKVAGSLPGVGDGASVAVMDIAAVQWRFGRLGRLDRLDLVVADRSIAEKAIRDLLPGDAVLATAAADGAQGDALSRAYRVNLDMLALVALLTGGFLVYSAQSLSVVRRQRAFALARTLGLSRRSVVAALTLEGLAIGVVGATAGLLAGYALASAALHWFGGDLGAGYFRTSTVSIALQPVAAISFFLLGTMAACAGSALPARLAARAAPAAALRNTGDMLDPRVPVPWWPAAVLLAGGAAVSLLPAIAGLPVFGYVGMGLLLAGGVAGVPWFMRILIAPLARRSGHDVPYMLAVRHLHGAPNEAATALCGIVASTALMIAMATMVTSFRGAVDHWLGDVLRGDLYMRTAGGSAFDPGVRARIAELPGVAAASFSRQVPLTIAADRPPLMLIARQMHGGHAPLPQIIGPALPVPAGVMPVWVSEPAHRLHGWEVGDRIALPLAGGARFLVVGIWRDYARQAGAAVIDEADYSRLTGDDGRDEAQIDVAADRDVAEVSRQILMRLPSSLREQVEITRPAVLRRFALTLFDRSFAITYLLEAVAILVGLAGVAATMSAQTIAREREFGMLRHLGVTRAQLTRMLATEGAIVGAAGGLAGIVLGLLLAQVLIHVINPQSFNWTMSTRVPFSTLAAVAFALTAAAAATAAFASRRATVRGAVQSVREDW